MHAQTPTFRLPVRGSSIAAAFAVLVVLLAGLPVLSGPAWAAEQVFVSPSGSDANPGSQAAPWKTLAKGLAAVKPGQTLVVRGGTYAERLTSVPITAGTPTARTQVVNYPGERPLVQGLLWLKGASYWDIRGINVTWSSANRSGKHMVKLTGGTGWTFTDAEVWGARSYAAILVAGEASGWTVARNYVHDTYATNGTNQDHLIYANSGTGGGTIERNLLVSSSNGRAVKVGPPSATSGIVENVVIRYNTMVDNLGPSNVQLAWGTSRVDVYRNIMVKPGSNKSAVTAYQLTGVSNVVTDNLVWNAVRPLDTGVAGLVDGGGNITADPKFDADYRPTAAVASGYGRYAGDTTEPTTAPVSDASAIVFHGASAATNNTATKLGLARPAGTVAGDVLVASVDVRGRPTITAPSGWTLLSTTDNGSVMRKATYWRVTADTDPTAWSWTFTTAQAATGVIVAHGGVSSVAPVATWSASPNTSSKNVAAPGVTTQVAGTVVLGLFGTGTETSITPPVGLTERAEAAATSGTYRVTSEASTFTAGDAGGTGTRTATASISAANIGQLVALRPAA